VAGPGGLSPLETNLGDVAFVQAGFLPALGAGAGTAGTGAAATAGAAGTVAAAPVLAAIASGVVLVAAGAWALTPEQHRAALLKQTLATARGMLQAAGLAPEQINGPLRQIDSAFRQGKSAVDALVNQWRNADTASPPRALVRSRVQPTGGAFGRRTAHSPQGPNGPQQLAASALPPRSSGPQLSAADRRTLQSLHSQVEALQAQAGRVLTPAQLANGSLLKQLAQLEKSAATLLRQPGAQAHRAELTALQSQARQAVAGLYRLTAHKAVAGLLTAGRKAPHAAQAYSAHALQQLLTQARQLLTAADAPLLAGLQKWLAQRQAPVPVLDWPGRLPTRPPAPAAPEAPGQRSNTPHTNTANGAVTGDAARALEQKSAQERAENVRRAADWVYNRQRSGATLAPADLAAQAAMLFGVRADEVLSALANRGSGVQGAQGGTRASAGQGDSGGAHINGSTGSREPGFEDATGRKPIPINGSTAVDQAAGYPKDVSGLYESLRNLERPIDPADSNRLSRFILESLVHMSLDVNGRIGIDNFREGITGLREASANEGDNINLGRRLSWFEDLADELENLRWRHGAIKEIPSQLEQILGAPGANAAGGKEAVIFDYDGTMTWLAGGRLPMNLIVDEREWLFAVFDHAGYKGYAEKKIREFEAENKKGIEEVPIQSVLDAVLLAQQRGLRVFVVTANQHEDKLQLISNQLKKWGLSNIEVFQTGYGQNKTELIDQKIVGQGYAVRATVGDSSGGDEYQPYDEPAPFIWVPTFLY
jgi:hypothetical protein